MGDVDEETGRGRVLRGGHRDEPGVDDDGVPASRPVDGWLGLGDEGGIPDSHLARWLQAVLRFSRPDGSAIFGTSADRAGSRRQELVGWADRVGDPGLSAVVGGWAPSRAGAGASRPPLPTAGDARPDRPLAVLRPDWSRDGDWLAIDHRELGDPARFELGVGGRAWLGPSWRSGLDPSGARVGRARPTSATSGLLASGVEWTYKVGPTRVTRSAGLLWGRSMALIGQEEDGPGGPIELRLGLAEGVEARPAGGGLRMVELSAGRGRPKLRLVPLGLPMHDLPGSASGSASAVDRGSIAIEGGEVVVRQPAEGRRRWASLLIGWGKAPTAWRRLTVSARSRACPADVAVASRVAWGPSDDGLVVYRSLAPPALRTFLGHQTGARFLVGSLDRSGDVRPILKVEG